MKGGAHPSRALFFPIQFRYLFAAGETERVCQSLAGHTGI